MTVEKKQKHFNIFDWLATALGIVVVGFIVFILIWPLIDPTPETSSSIQENIHALTGK